VDVLILDVLILDFGFWILDFGFWILDFGFSSFLEMDCMLLSLEKRINFLI
jgi:hypothetical protein